jgi:hypothetical protein
MVGTKRTQLSTWLVDSNACSFRCPFTNKYDQVPKAFPQPLTGFGRYPDDHCNIGTTIVITYHRNKRGQGTPRTRSLSSVSSCTNDHWNGQSNGVFTEQCECNFNEPAHIDCFIHLNEVWLNDNGYGHIFMFHPLQRQVTQQCSMQAFSILHISMSTLTEDTVLSKSKAHRYELSLVILMYRVLDLVTDDA